eukprot:358923-Chlamydomonas_euryale.AAC.2
MVYAVFSLHARTHTHTRAAFFPPSSPNRCQELSSVLRFVCPPRRYSDAARLWLAKDGGCDGARVSAVDMAVYSRMRHFRMLWSCKGGKQAVLMPTKRCVWAAGPHT